MANKVPWYEMIDWKSILGVIIVIILIAVIMVYKFLPELVRNEKMKNYDGESIGYIISIEENTKLKQYHDGNKLEVDSYTVKYSYMIEGKSFESIDNIKGTDINANFLIKHSEAKFKDPVQIKFDKSNPKNSLIRLYE